LANTAISASALRRFRPRRPGLHRSQRGRLRRSNFRKFWHRAREAVGLPELHFHDLRHTGNTMAAAEGASLCELMKCMGHSSPRAVPIYLHATRERDKKIARSMGKTFTKARNGSGTQRARKSGNKA
jgi:integrase